MDILEVEAKPPRKSEILAVRIETQTLRDLTAIAFRKGMKASSAARLVLENFVRTYPDYGQLPLKTKRSK